MELIYGCFLERIINDTVQESSKDPLYGQVDQSQEETKNGIWLHLKSSSCGVHIRAI